MKNSSAIKQFEPLSTPFDVLIGRASMVGFVLSLGVYLTVEALSPTLISG